MKPCSKFYPQILIHRGLNFHLIDTKYQLSNQILKIFLFLHNQIYSYKFPHRATHMYILTIQNDKGREKRENSPSICEGHCDYMAVATLFFTSTVVHYVSSEQTGCFPFSSCAMCECTMNNYFWYNPWSNFYFLNNKFFHSETLPNILIMMTHITIMNRQFLWSIIIWRTCRRTIVSLSHTISFIHNKSFIRCIVF